MAKLIYSRIMSLDGYTADANGRFDWSMPDEEVHSFVNDLQLPPVGQASTNELVNIFGHSAARHR